jgi:hypothetical protein
MTTPTPDSMRERLIDLAERRSLVGLRYADGEGAPSVAVGRIVVVDVFVVVVLTKGDSWRIKVNAVERVEELADARHKPEVET